MRFALLLFAILPACSYRVEKEALDKAKVNPQAVGFTEVQVAVLGPKCARCHGFVATYEGVIANLADISARVSSTDADFMMPPPNAAPLTADEKAALLGWIARGAPRVGGGEVEQPATPPSPPVPAPVPSPPVPPSLPPQLTYANVRDSVLVPKCARCHSALVNSYDEVLVNLSEIASRVRSPFDFDQMPPPRAAQLTEEEKNLLLDWIEAGAPKEAAL
jgi:uncharacterized membrane protein